MRPVANFTLHAILAAALAALATTSAAAGEARLTLGGSTAGGGGSHIKVENYSWGSTHSSAGLGGWSKVDGLAVNLGSMEQAGAASSDMSIKGSKIKQNAPTAEVPPTLTLKRGRISAIPKYEVETARDAASGQASGKRQHQPAAPGSLTLRASLPGCAAGTAYPTGVLQTETARYELEDLVVIRCASDSVSFNYGRVVVR